MGYDADTDPYLDPATGILRNMLDITTADKLEEAEGIITSTAIVSLKDSPVLGGFDLAHLQAVHRRLFQFIYSWAGELRTVEIAKGATRFANTDFLPQAASDLFAHLKAENLLVDLTANQYAERFAHYYSEVNILHPFREGNGRTQRAFFTLLAAQSGRTAAWDKLDPAQNIAASSAAYNGDESGLVALMNVILKPQS